MKKDMEAKQINSLIDAINNREYKKELLATKLFAGADLVITNNKSSFENNEDYAGDILVETKYARALSWLVYKLKEIFQSELDYLNKFYFYPEIGRVANRYLQYETVTEQDLLLYVVDNIKDIDL